jgi:hypothetical protein
MTRKSLVAVLLAVMAVAPALARADAATPDLSLTPGDLAAPLAQVAGTSDSGTGRIFSSALYGGLAGALIGGGVGLIENGNYGRDIAIGAGVGVLVGAALGAANAFQDTRAFPASDGLNSTDKYPVLQGRTMAFGGTF